MLLPVEFAVAEPASRNPITGIAAYCARATSGHVAALPSPAMNARRRMAIPPKEAVG